VTPAVDAFLERARTEHPPPAGDARYGGRVVVGAISELANGMNVVATSDDYAAQHQRFVALMTLVDYDEALEPRPYLAKSWAFAPDGRSVTFNLRTDVLWHDGEPTTAADIAFTYRMVTDPDAGFPNASYWDQWVRGARGVEVVDDSTVRMHLRPHAEPLDPWRTVGILPEHLLGHVAPADLRRHPFGSRCPVGNGPFVFREHREGDSWVFAANPAFPEELGGRPFLDQYVYRVVPDGNTLLLELRSGGIDVYVAAQPEQARTILDDPALELLTYPSRGFTFAAWNTRRPKLADPRVRRALTLATDRDAIVAALLDGYGAVATGTVPSFHWAYDPEAGRLPHDPEGARRLLAEAGWTDRDGDGVVEAGDGSPLWISLATNQGNPRLARLAVVVQAQLRKVGVAVDIETREWSALVDAVTDPERRDFDGVILSWVTDFRLDDTDLFHSSRADEPYGFAGIADPTLDAFLERLPLIQDRSQARRMWRAYQEALAEAQPFTFFYAPDRLTGIRRRVRGVRMDARGEWLDLRRWWLAPS
jgi:peptide/nickel transport system substrate-binding protein